MKKLFVLLCAIFSGLLAAPEVKSANRCPEISRVSLSESAVHGGEQVAITVTAGDSDNDQLFYFWVASRGILAGRNAQVVWTAPGCVDIDKTAETYEITIEVTDGECTDNHVIGVLVKCSLDLPGENPDSVILFSSGSTGLNMIAKAQLDRIVTLLKQFADHTITIEGHADATGNDEINRQIGLKRAESVKRYLVKQHGVAPNRIITHSYGSAKPVAPNDTDEGRAKNRRVEIYRRF